MDFLGKKAVVTGGASGIGRALVAELTRRGAHVAFCDVADGDAVLDQVARHRGEAHYWRVDVSDREAMRTFVAEVLERLGAVDLLVNNAGIALGDRTFEEVTVEDLERITNINYWGVVHTTQLLYPHLLSRPRAAIVNLSSSQGILAAPYLVPYCTTKFAVRGFTDALRVEHEVRGIRHVTVHTVHPGAVATEITLNADYHGPSTQQFHENLQRQGAHPDEAARVILRGVQRGHARIFISDGRLQDLVARLAPTQLGRILRLLMRWKGIHAR